MTDSPRPEPEIVAALEEALSDLVGSPLNAAIRREAERRLEARLLIIGELMQRPVSSRDG